MPAAWVGAAASAVGAGESLFGGGGGSSSSGSSSSTGTGGYGDPGSLISGGLSAALGLNQLLGSGSTTVQGSAQAGAVAANPAGQFAQGYEPALQALLQGPGLTSQILGDQGAEAGLLESLLGSANIGTNTGALPTNVGTNTTALAGLTNVGTPTQNAQLQALVNNPTQLIKTLQGGGVSTPASLEAVANQNPYGLNAGEQFQETQGEQALNRSLAQTGQTGSGNQLVAAEQYGQNFASQSQAANIAQMESAQGTINQTAQTNQGLQAIVNNMGQTQFGETASLASLLQGQNQANFSNTLGTQQLETQEEQGTFANTLQQQQLQTQQQTTSQTNLQNLLSQLIGLNTTATGQEIGELNPLLSATETNQSSPSSAGQILSEEFANANNAAGNVTSGIGGIANGLAGATNSINSIVNGFGASGSENPGAASTSTPDDLISGFTGSVGGDF
jgi:hypothetical protein